MIYDCFLYNGEYDMLNLRLHELNDYVDFFVINESEFTYSGNKKTIKFTEHYENFSKFKDKIIFIKHNEEPIKIRWEDEYRHRRHFKTYFNKVKLHNDDIIMLSDVDEIPDTNLLIDIQSISDIVSFSQNFYYYNINCRNRNKWRGTVACKSKYLINNLNYDFQNLRNSKNYTPLINPKNDFNSGGWHFSYFGDISYIINKIESFSHTEYNHSEYKNPLIIKKLMESGQDLFFRKDELFDIITETYLPKYINLLNVYGIN